MQGLTVHDGIDISGSRLRYADMGEPSTFHELVGLSLRRVVREWHCGLPCISFGTLRRPQVRSKEFPGGFDSSDPFTRYHNVLARGTAFLLTICVLQGQYISVEQPGSSRLYLLHCYQVLVMLGCVISHYCFCGFGSPLQKASKWLHNKPWLVGLECICQCEYKGKHFVVHGSFSQESRRDFIARCRPSCVAVYGREPIIGETVANFSAQYPFGLVTQMASGSAKAKRGVVDPIPASVRARSLEELDIHSSMVCTGPNTEELFQPRQWHEDPEWVSVIADSMIFKEMFRYRCSRSSHINVNEARVYKSWIKSLAKTEEDCRAVGLLDSRVTIGASAKGRSSSFAISRVLQTTMPYIIGGGLYPGLLHVGSSRNRADGPTRNRSIDPPTKELPEWLTELQAGRPKMFDALRSRRIRLGGCDFYCCWPGTLSQIQVLGFLVFDLWSLEDLWIFRLDSLLALIGWQSVFQLFELGSKNTLVCLGGPWKEISRGSFVPCVAMGSFVSKLDTRDIFWYTLSQRFKTIILAPECSLGRLGKSTKSGRSMSRDNAERCFHRWSSERQFAWLPFGDGGVGWQECCWLFQLCCTHRSFLHWFDEI